MSVLVRMESVHKSFSGVPVLTNGVLEVKAGEVHALMGANGAGKSTLMKILAGVHPLDSGEIQLVGDDRELKPVRIANPEDARRLGVGIVFQELNLIPEMSVEDNISLGREAVIGRLLLDRRVVRRIARDALAAVAPHVDPTAAVRSLSPAEQQLVEIAGCLATESRIIILDEPTTSLSTTETEVLFDVISRLRREGMGIIYISHRMEEVFRLADRITVMRDGKHVSTHERGALDRDGLVRAMLGRTLSREMQASAGEAASPVPGHPVLRARGVSRGLVRDADLDLHSGEVVGMFGLVGSGRTELARCVFGIDPMDSGTVEVDGRPVRPGSAVHAVQAGMALVPEDRKSAGLVLDLAVGRNLELAALAQGGGAYWKSSPERELWTRYAQELGIVARDRHQPSRQLSGGNQQKVVLSKWLAVSPKILILDEPTRGVDVGAKQDIYQLIRSLADSGVAVWVISSEIEEISMLADRVVVMREGSLVFDAANTGLDHQTIFSAAMGAV